MFRMRHFVYLFLLVLLAFCRVHAQTAIYDCYNGSSEQGGNRLTVNGIQTNQYAQQSYPGTTTTVYIHNTLTLATLFQDEAGVVPLSNPFTSSSHSVAFVCISDGRYDFKYSGTTITTPFTVSDIKFCFACQGGGGGGGGTVNGTPPHVAKFTAPTAVGDSSGLDPGNTPTQWPLGLNVIGNAGYVQKTAGTGGVVANELVSNDGNADAIVTPLGTSKALGIADVGVAVGAAVPVAVWGFHNCIFDNQTAASDYVGPSSTVDGLCSDLGATKPNNVEIIGIVNTVNTGAGTLAVVDLFTGDTVAPGSSGGSGTVSPCASSNSVAFYQTPGSVINCDSLHTDDAIGHVTALTLGLTDTTSAGFWWWVNGPLPPAPPANSVQLIAPTSITTSYTWTLPTGIVGTGVAGDCISVASVSGAVATLDLVPCSGGGGGSGTVTSVAAGTGLAATPSPITTTGTLRIADTAVTPGSCTNCDLTINQQGQIIAQANGSSGGTGTVTSVGLSLPSIFTVTGTPVTTSGTLGATLNVPGADYLPTSTAASTINWEQINAGADCGDGTHAVSYATVTHTFGCQTLTTGGSGSVTSVGLSINGGSSSGIFAATGTPVTTSGTLNYNLSGTSGGVPYFSSSSIISSSALLTASNPVIGGGAGTAPSSGTRSGNTTTFGTTSGSLTNGNVAKFDASGNIIDGGTVATSSGNCNSGAAMCYYPLNNSAGTTNNKIAKWVGQGVNNGTIGTTVTGDGTAGVSVAYAGVVVTGAGTTGNATVAYSGTVTCLFDATAPIQGHSVEISSTVAGACHDMGVFPANENPDTHFIIGVVESGSGGASANNTVDLMPITAGFGNYECCGAAMALLAGSIYGTVQASPSMLWQTDSTKKTTADLLMTNTGTAGFRFGDPSNGAFYSKIRQCGTGGTCGAGSHDFLIDVDGVGFSTTSSLRVNGNYYSIPQAKGTTSGTVTLFTTAADEHTVTMNGNTTLTLNASLNPGQHFTVHVCQDGIGGRTLTWPTTMLGHGIMPAAASACLTQGFIYNDAGGSGVPATGPAISTPVVLTSQTAAVTTTTLASVTADSTYRVTATLDCDSSSAAATVNVTIGWTDPSNTAQTATLGTAVVCTTLGSASVGNLVVAFRAKSGTNITYATAIVNTPTYDVVIGNPETISIN